MLDKPPTPATPATEADNQAVDAAINRVLLRERAAREAIAECQRRAEAILAAARAQARAVERRGEARETLLHARSDRRVEDQVSALLRQAPAPADALTAEQRARLERAIQMLCDEMVGGVE